MKYAATIVLGLVSVLSVAQGSIDIFTGSFRHGFKANAEDLSGDAYENMTLVNLKFPIVFSESTIWYNDLTYQSPVVHYSDDFSNAIRPTRLYGFLFQTGLVQRLTETTAVQLLMMPRFMTDFKGVGLQHFQFGGIGLFEKKYHDRFMMRYGLLYNRELFGHVFVPLVYVDWKLSDKWSVTGLLPIFSKISYQVTDNLSFGFNHFGLVTSYQLGDAAYNNDYIERKSIDVTLFGRIRIAGNFHFETRAGYALGRSYRQYEEGDELDFKIITFSFGDDRVQKNIAFDPGPILDFRIVYNLPLD